MNAPTNDEIMRVRKFECATHGHTYTELVTIGGGPQAVTCTNCGAYWRIHPDDLGWQL